MFCIMASSLFYLCECKTKYRKVMTSAYVSKAVQTAILILIYLTNDAIISCMTIIAHFFTNGLPIFFQAKPRTIAQLCPYGYCIAPAQVGFAPEQLIHVPCQWYGNCFFIFFFFFFFAWQRPLHLVLFLIAFVILINYIPIEGTTVTLHFVIIMQFVIY